MLGLSLRDLKKVELIHRIDKYGYWIFEINYPNNVLKGLIFQGDQLEYRKLILKFLEAESIRLFHEWEKNELTNWGST